MSGRESRVGLPPDPRLEVDLRRASVCLPVGVAEDVAGSLAATGGAAVVVTGVEASGCCSFAGDGFTSTLGAFSAATGAGVFVSFAASEAAFKMRLTTGACIGALVLGAAGVAVSTKGACSDAVTVHVLYD